MSSDEDAASPGDAMVAELMRFIPDGQTPNSWAVGAGVSRAVWGDIRRHGNPSRRTLERLLHFAGSSLAEFEALRIGAPVQAAPADQGLVAERRRGWGLAPDPVMPCYQAVAIEPITFGSVRVPAFRLGSAMGQGAPTPPRLRKLRGNYAFVVPVGAMWPRFRQGRTLIVTPAERAEIGDDAMICLSNGDGRDGQERLVAEIVWQDIRAIRLRIFAPGAEFTILRGYVRSIERIAGESI